MISASWLSRTGEGDGTLNLRGVAEVLALAGFLKRIVFCPNESVLYFTALAGYSLWAKDIIFVVSDGYLEGMHAWLSAYHGTLSSKGLNGRLPNQDLLNSLHRISQKEGVPVINYDHVGLDSLPSRIPKFIREKPEVQAYVSEAKNILRQFEYQTQGRPSGIHGLFHRFRIDAITLFALPAAGPHGFHAIGRIIESTLRTSNNLLERLHASFFFYVLTGPDRFLKIGSYLPSAVLISVAMMFGGLKVWTSAAWMQLGVEKTSANEWSRRRRPVLTVLGIMSATHACGALLFGVITSSWFIEHLQIASPAVFASFALSPLCVLLVPPYHPSRNTSPLSAVLKGLNMCFASTVISITTVLNFPLAALLAIALVDLQDMQVTPS
ncbi:hypothetical protein H0H87_002891 [Tephrocybe sp. NHM501043]|nr:hypothetical protein H0H87_002891 [Tephrocybe sp. NHM501043]